jgi:hypothetical protein
MSMSEEKSCGCGHHHHEKPKAPEGPLNNWPIQLHLVSPTADYFQGANVVLAADCVAFAMKDFQEKYLEDKALAIACPKLDDGQDSYLTKIKTWVNDAKISTLVVMIMEVPCCQGLLVTARQALSEVERKVPFKVVTVGRNGSIVKEEWVN